MMTITRLPDWPQRLDHFVTERLAWPFAWGRHDCAAFAADAVLAMTGIDHLKALRGAHQNERQALRRLRELGGLPAVLAHAAMAPVAPLVAQRGDLVTVSMGRREVLAVSIGVDAVAPGPAGLEFVGMWHAHAAWRV